MKIKLENIGIIKKAEIIFDGLSVVAGENDTGKSTIGKILYALIRTIRWSSSAGKSVKQTYMNTFNRYITKLFKNQISSDGVIVFEYMGSIFTFYLHNHRCTEIVLPDDFTNEEAKVFSPLFIDTPYIWNLLPSLKTMKTLEQHQEIGVDFEIFETFLDLYYALNTKLKDDNKIKIDIASIIDGNFQENEFGEFVFVKDKKNIELVNTAMGIKYFGTFDVLSSKNHLYTGQILILDEPEVHLHPKWQLKLAEVIVYLVVNGVKIFVNSHSPYMIEALQRYGKKMNIKQNFYLANDRKIIQDDASLSKIFAKLSEPFDTFDAMDREILHG